MDHGPSACPVPPSLPELPLLAAHGTVLLHLLRVQPLEDAVHVEAVRALPPHQRTVVTGNFTCGTERPSAPPSAQCPVSVPVPHSQSGQQPLKAIRQIPQFSSFATHSQDATPCQLRTRTRMFLSRSRCGPAGSAAHPTKLRAPAAQRLSPASSASGAAAARPEVRVGAVPPSWLTRWTCPWTTSLS